MGSKSDLLRALVAVSGGKSAAIGVPSRGPKWRRGWEAVLRVGPTDMASRFECGHIADCRAEVERGTQGGVDGMSRQIEHHGYGDGSQDQPCAICRGKVSSEFVALISQAAAQPGRAMTANEFMTWLNSFDAGSPDSQ